MGWFKVGQVIGSKVIKSVEPKLTKGESTKVWGKKSRGKFKKALEEASTGIDKATFGLSTRKKDKNKNTNPKRPQGGWKD